MRRSTIWYVAIGSFLVYVILVWILSGLLKLHGSDVWLVRIALWAVGLAATVLVAWYYARRAPVAAPPSSGSDDDNAFATARSALATSRRAPGGLPSLPIVLLVGAEGSAKTTTVVRAGIEPELLAGDVFRGEATTPTAGVNVWFAGDAAIVEAGGPLVADAERWDRLIPHLLPRSIGAAFAGGAQAARVALVCVSIEALTAQGGAEAMQATARTLRDRLAELSQRLGVRLPVYVLFTKMDRLPFFADYVQNLSRDEAREVLGVSFTADPGGSTGQYADHQAARVTAGLEALFRSLADKRLPLLSREHAEAHRLAAYEFPREFRKLIPGATQFLVDLCRPSQLQVYPFLRGAYFTGVQAVIVTDSAPASQARAEQQQSSAGQATSVFQLGASAAAQPAAAARSGARKVPRWDFLPRLFPDVIFADRVAMGAKRGGTRVNVLRRALLGAAAVVAFICAIGVTISYFGNRDLVNGIRDGNAALAAMPPAGSDLPSADALKRLDSLRAHVVELETYQKDGPPMHLRWGLYHGDALLPAARAAYFDQFARQVFDSTRGRMLASLKALPDAPRETSEYGTTYNTLKAYLITTSESPRSTSEFLSPVLMANWQGPRLLDSDRQQLARRQFDYYATALHTSNPYPASPDAALVGHTRTFLQAFAGGDRIYQFMLSEAAHGNPPIEFNRKVPGSGAYVVDTYEVPGAFTKGGWTFMQNAFQNADRFFQGESWVIGEQSLGQVDRAKVIDELKTRYRTEYAQQWRMYLRNASVVHFAGLKDAAQKLSALSGNQSPLLMLFSIASQNTAVDTQAVGPVFQPVQLIVAPTATDKLIGEANAGYMNALVTLQSSLDQASNAQPGQAEGPVAQAASNAATAKVTTKQLAQGFKLDRVGNVETTVQRLLEQPIDFAEGLTRNFGSSELNGKGRALCTTLRPLLAKFPFNPTSTSQATMAEVAQVFRPQTGAIWTLYDDVLQKSLVKVGMQYVTREGGGGPPLSPAFVAFFNRAAGVTQALYRDNSPDPRLAIVVRPILTDAVPSATLTIDGQTAQFTRKAAQPKQFIWIGSPTGSARLSAQLGNTQLQLLSFDGPWALFQLFFEADRWQPGTAPQVEWSMRTRGQQATLPDGSVPRVTLELSLEGLPPVMQKGWLAQIGCVPDIAK